MRHLDAESIVVASYSACCLEKLVHLVGKNDQLAAQAPTILHGLMVLMQKPAHKENDYAMRGLNILLYL